MNPISNPVWLGQLAAEYAEDDDVAPVAVPELERSQRAFAANPSFSSTRCSARFSGCVLASMRRMAVWANKYRHNNHWA